MATITATNPLPSPISSVPAEQMFRLTIGQYHEMIERGILRDSDEVELLEGWLVEKRGKNPPHRIATRLLTQALSAIIPPGWYVDSQEPITTKTSEPEPDVAVIRGNTRDYADRHPGPADVALVVEIAEASLDRDRQFKQRIYASAAMPEYWIVNLAARTVETYSLPGTGGQNIGYTNRQDFSAGQNVPVMIERKLVGQIAVNDILP